jgi:hypothetical protein
MAGYPKPVLTFLFIFLVNKWNFQNVIFKQMFISCTIVEHLKTFCCDEKIMIIDWHFPSIFKRGNKTICRTKMENKKSLSIVEMSSAWWHGLRWGLNHLLTCLKVLLDFTSGQIFRSLASLKTKKRLVPLQDDLLLQSATVLANKIRERKVNRSCNNE